MIDRLFVLIQYLLPQHGLSRLAGRLAQSTRPWLKNALIKAFIRRYGVDMSEAEQTDPTVYPCFNAFYPRFKTRRPLHRSGRRQPGLSRRRLGEPAWRD